jgi:hypothetical protein
VCDEYGRSTTYATPSYTTPKKPIWRHTTRLQCRRYTLPVFLFLHYSSPLEAVEVADVKVTFACHGANHTPSDTYVYIRVWTVVLHHCFRWIPTLRCYLILENTNAEESSFHRPIFGLLNILTHSQFVFIELDIKR